MRLNKKRRARHAPCSVDVTSKWPSGASLAIPHDGSETLGLCQRPSLVQIFVKAVLTIPNRQRQSSRRQRWPPSCNPTESAHFGSVKLVREKHRRPETRTTHGLSDWHFPRADEEKQTARTLTSQTSKAQLRRPVQCREIRAFTSPGLPKIETRGFSYLHTTRYRFYETC